MELSLYHLLYAELPLTWKKDKGGVVVQWIGYELDVKNFVKGISLKKQESWVEKRQAEGGVVGRDLKSALGRLTFVVSHVRPFLGVLFAWAAVLAMGTFASLPSAVALVLQLIKMEVQRRRLRPVSHVPVASRLLPYRCQGRGAGDRAGRLGVVEGAHFDCQMVLGPPQPRECTVGLRQGRAVQGHCLS